MVMMTYYILCLLLFVTSSAAQRRDEGDTSLGRLPTDLWPSHYTLELQPDIYTGQPPFYFNGSMDVTFECTNPTAIIYLNNLGLTVDESTLYIVLDPASPVQGPDPVWIRTEYDEAFEFYKIFLDDYLLLGAVYQMGMVFSGEIAPPSANLGIFYTSYTSLIDGSTKYQVITQLQSNYGHRLFPHFDEPMFKATFATTLVRKSHVIALSNGNLINSVDRGDDWIADTFNTTVKMSSYLNCLAIGEFGYLESTTASDIPIRVWARPEYVEDLVFAQSQAAAIHDYYEQYTGIQDPMPKLDHIAFPGFNVGAMENWGLIPYGEFYLLYNDSRDSLIDQRTVASVIGHETAHLWFGDLVTCRWWTDSWLNEGFATFFADLPYDSVWGISGNDKALYSEIRSMLEQDSSNTSVSVRQLVETPWDPTSSGFSYGKGSAVLRMLRQILGADTLQRGLQRYLNTYAYDVVETDHLWKELTDQAEIDGVTDTDGNKLFIKEKMDPWTDQRGYPLISVIRTSPGSADVTQTQFLSPKDQSSQPSPFLYEWYVPLTVTSEETPTWSTETTDWLNRDNKTITTGIPNSMDEWFVVNIDQSGFFRVQYDNNTFHQLVDQLDANASVIPSSSRFAILNDAFEITRAGLDTEVHAMETTRFLDQEDNYVVWDTADRALDYPSIILSRYTSTYTEFQSYMRSKVDPVYTRFGWDNTGSSNFESSTRAIAIGLACNYGNTDCEQQARILFDQLMGDPSTNNIAIDLRVPVYCTTMVTGSQLDWDALHAVYLDVQDSPIRDTQDEVNRILTSLACSEDDAVLQRYINLTFDPTQIISGDVNNALNSIASSSRGRWVLWEHFNATWNVNPVPPGADRWNPFQNIMEGFANDDDILELEAFIAKYPPIDQYETDRYNLAMETVNNNKKWADDNQPDLHQWLQGHTESTVTGSHQTGSNHGMRDRVAQLNAARRWYSTKTWHY